MVNSWKQFQEAVLDQDKMNVATMSWIMCIPNNADTTATLTLDAMMAQRFKKNFIPLRSRVVISVPGIDLICDPYTSQIYRYYGEKTLVRIFNLVSRVHTMPKQVKVIPNVLITMMILYPQNAPPTQMLDASQPLQITNMTVKTVSLSREVALHST